MKKSKNQLVRLNPYQYIYITPAGQYHIMSVEEVEEITKKYFPHLQEFSTNMRLSALDTELSMEREK